MQSTTNKIGWEEHEAHASEGEDVKQLSISVVHNMIGTTYLPMRA